ncbi:MAG: tRNA (adenosine(37)-N6)-threonylcarbamoyltransferase complex ATPase subunit type 1 TsaE [Oscillospiraceae bacterium]|jgi:tRNA threonylcarbamoyladenosine biosynthesis protein TsaE|nr:tRNA (adenosine(37)-N6)-threonylcarbamoyltransferase complex ATPase subunit type 1 TsaE [Oscillospiraceae bacterium]
MRSRSAAETERFGEELGILLRPGDTVWVYGELGAGKTAFARGLARGLGITEQVTSPTYAVANTYMGQTVFTHIDAYRLSGPDELFGAGLDEDDGIRAVEWAERAGTDIRGICVMIEATGGEEREISLCYLL